MDNTNPIEEFKAKVAMAQGRSEDVVVVFMDIRGFTAFCEQVKESGSVADYITAVYPRFLSKFSDTATFCKPTGDGLMVITPYNRQNIERIARDTIKRCLECHTEFPDICRDDPMINFPTPAHLGIGVARGKACCLFHEDEVLDYSGRILNLAARLMDLARPSGVVFDFSYGINLLEEDLQDLFEPTSATIRGISEKEPLQIYVQKDAVKLINEIRLPLDDKQLADHLIDHGYEGLKKLAKKINKPKS